MNFHPLRLAIVSTVLLAVPLSAVPQSQPTQSQPAQSQPAAAHDRWLHIRIVSSDASGEVVRVNVPVELAEKVLPTIHHDRLRDGKIKIEAADTQGVDLRALLDAVRSSKDGEFVTVQSKENDVRIAKSGKILVIHVVDHSGTAAKSGAKARPSQVEIKVPIKVVDALLSAGKDELDISAALRALAQEGDTELVSVRNEDNRVRIWLDSKNVAD